MPDWRELVRQHLAGLSLDAAGKEEICSEVAEHLEDCYESLRTSGLPEDEAVRRALVNTPNWEDLRREIFAARKKEYPMKKRLQQLWIPGFLTLTLSTIFLMALVQHRFQPRVVFWAGPNSILLYTPWLLSLPAFGAIGACLSSRARGSQGTVLFASIFPVTIYAAAIFILLPLSSLADSHVRSPVRLMSLLRAALEWIVIPGVALLAGGLTAHFFLSRRHTDHVTVIG